MIHVTQKLDFSQGALCIDSVIESVSNLFDRHLLPSLLIDSRAKTSEKGLILEANKFVFL
jgi:hypothetical protein